MCAQEMRTEMHGRFDNTEDVVRVEAVAMREAVYTEAEATRQAVAQVRRLYQLAILPP